MKKILATAILALTVTGSVASTASAGEFGSKEFWQEQSNRGQ